jgi:integral membrane protein (TIGR01906 family)
MVYISLLNKCLLYFALLFLIVLVPTLKLSLFLTSTQSFRDPLAQTHLEIKAARRLNLNIVRFIQGKEALDEAFTRMERIHMHDVKHLFSIGEACFSLSLGYFLLALFFLPRLRKGETLYQVMVWSGGTILCLGGAALLFMMFDFQIFFIGFHKVFFPQGNWSFSPHSLLIQLYPKPFFKAMGKVVFLSIVTLGLAVWMMGILMKNKLFSGLNSLL